MRDSKPQRCVQHHKSLKVTRNPTNRDKHINEASKQTNSSNLFKISCKDTQGMLSNWKVCFNAINLPNFDVVWCVLSKINVSVQRLTSANFQI